MCRRIKASWTAILMFTLVGAGYLWMYRWRHRVCALTDSGAATELRCDNAMETDGGSNNTNSDVSTRTRMRDAVYRKLKL
jgi:hypothetical protein